MDSEDIIKKIARLIDEDLSGVGDQDEFHSRNAPNTPEALISQAFKHLDMSMFTIDDALNALNEYATDLGFDINEDLVENARNLLLQTYTDILERNQEWRRYRSGETDPGDIPG